MAKQQQIYKQQQISTTMAKQQQIYKQQQWLNNNKYLNNNNG